MNQFIQICIAGLTVGCVYALVGVGFALIFNASRIFNFAQGDWLMLGAMLYFTFSSLFHLPLVLSLLLAIIAMGIVGLLVQALLVEPIRRRQGQIIMMVIATLAFSVIAESGAQTIWGTGALKIEPLVAGDLHFDKVTATGSTLVVILATVALCIFLWAFFRYTFMGKAYLATASHREAAQLVGINVSLMVVVAFVLSGMAMAVAGATVGALTFASATMGATLGVNGFAAAVVGGIRNPFGAVLGGAVLGLAEAAWAAFVGPDFAKAIAYLVLLVVLFVRPEGILGRSVART